MFDQTFPSKRVTKTKKIKKHTNIISKFSTSLVVDIFTFPSKLRFLNAEDFSWLLIEYAYLNNFSPTGDEIEVLWL